MAILAYILFFIPLLAGEHRKSPFVKYHTNQGTVLALFAIAWGIVSGILKAIFRAALLSNAVYDALYYNPYAVARGVGSFGAYGVIALILNLIWLAPTALLILGIYNAVNGMLKPLPVIGNITIIK